MSIQPLPAEVTEYEQLAFHAIDNLIVVNDTGSVLHWFPNAKGAYRDNTEKEHTIHVIDKNGDKRSLYCGSIVYMGDPDGKLPSPEELIKKHGSGQDKMETGLRQWGRTL